MLTVASASLLTNMMSMVGGKRFWKDPRVRDMAPRLSNQERAKEDQQRKRTNSALDDLEFIPDSRVNSDVTEDQLWSKRSKIRQKNREIQQVEDLMQVHIENPLTTPLPNATSFSKRRQNHLGHNYPKLYRQYHKPSNKEHRLRPGNGVAAEFDVEKVRVVSRISIHACRHRSCRSCTWSIEEDNPERLVFTSCYDKATGDICFIEYWIKPHRQCFHCGKMPNARKAYYHRKPPTS